MKISIDLSHPGFCSLECMVTTPDLSGMKGRPLQPSLRGPHEVQRQEHQAVYSCETWVTAPCCHSHSLPPALPPTTPPTGTATVRAWSPPQSTDLPDFSAPTLTLKTSFLGNGAAPSSTPQTYMHSTTETLSILGSGGFHVCKLSYLLKCTRNFQISPSELSQPFTALGPVVTVWMSVFMSPHSTFNKTSLTETHVSEVAMDWPIRMLGPEAHRKLMLCPREEGLSAGSFSALRDRINTATTNNDNRQIIVCTWCLGDSGSPQNNPTL